MKIFAFGHRQNVGKSTAVRFLIQELRLKKPGCNIMVTGFADKVKDIAYQLYAWTGLQPKHYYENENYGLKNVILTSINKTPRDIWIHVGNSLRTEGYDWTWAKVLFNQPKVDYLFIDDLRYPIEADYVLQDFGEVWRIDRPDQPVVNDGSDEQMLSYEGWTGVLLNDEGIKQFHNLVLTAILPRILA